MGGGWKAERQRKGQDSCLPLGERIVIPSKAGGTRYKGLRIVYCLTPHGYSRKTYKNNIIIINGGGRRRERVSENVFPTLT